MTQSKKVKVQEPQDQSLALIEKAITAGADPGTIEKLMDLQDRAHKKLAEEAFKRDFALMQQEMPRIEKKKKVSFGQGKAHYSYAPLEDIAEQIAPTLAKFGFSYHYEQSHKGELIKVICVLSHPLGHERRNEMVSTKLDAKQMNLLQAQAAAVTYMRRYTLTGVLGLSTADEDIDARLPEGIKTKSKALDSRLGPGVDVEPIYTKLVAANTAEQMEEVRQLINTLPPGSAGKEDLKNAFMEKRGQLQNGKVV